MKQRHRTRETTVQLDGLVDHGRDAWESGYERGRGSALSNSGSSSSSSHSGSGGNNVNIQNIHSGCCGPSVFRYYENGEDCGCSDSSGSSSSSSVQNVFVLVVLIVIALAVMSAMGNR